MQREDIKSYKDACKCIGRKPRVYKDTHTNTYEQLTTIIAALNFIANSNRPWQHEFGKGIKYWYIWCYYGRYSAHETLAGLFYLNSNCGVDPSDVFVGTQLRLKNMQMQNI